MKRFLSTAAVAVAGFCLTGNLNAQTRELRANIPFNFVVGNQQLPAGSYAVFPDNEHVLVIQNRKLIANAMSIVSNQDAISEKRCSLVFDKYGDRYFLREVHSNIVALNGAIPMSKLEKQTGRQEAVVRPETVQIAMGN